MNLHSIRLWICGLQRPQRMPRRLRRFLVVSFLIPFGILCFSYPILLVLASDVGPDLWADTKGSLGAGKDTAARVYRASCFGKEYGTNIHGSTQFECTLFLANASKGLIERTCSGNQTGRIPTLRLVASNPDRHAVSWGIGELFTRRVYVLEYPILVVVRFGVACFFASCHA